MTSDELLREIHTELLDLYTTFKPYIKQIEDRKMIELINRVGMTCAKIVDHERGTA